ncbi:MAG: glucans biosynthesis glucosyltransferase MdoH [Inquilinaceae bacterium]
MASLTDLGAALSDVDRLASIKRFRRAVVFGLALITTLGATIALHRALSFGGVTVLEGIMLALFAVNMGWIALSFWGALAGFLTLWFGWRNPGLKWPDAGDDSPLKARTAILMPVYNEAPSRVYANLEAIYESLVDTGQIAHFDMFVLSDSTDPNTWIAEEVAWTTLCRRVRGIGRIFYRKRRYNIARKSGNIEDFCRRWGNRYEHMVVLDADSVMTGTALVTLVRLMQANPTAGIIQAPPAIVNGHTLFARVQQFAGRLSGSVIAAGLSFWQVDDGNYWGHNAIIRTRAFTQHCQLPVLPGKAPFGGPILSHDFVEAAFMRRAGWRVWMVPELGGSFEECPPSAIDYAIRDRRWCQGNLQHLKVIPMRRLHPISRMHLAMGVMSYLSSPLWLAFLATGILAAVQTHLFPPVPNLPYQAYFTLVGGIHAPPVVTTFGVAMAMLVAPKLFGLALLLRHGHLRRGFGGFGRAVWGAVVETLFSALMAPAQMLFQSRFVAEILLGRDSGWKGQRRDGDGITWREAAGRHAGHTVAGLVIAVAGYFAMPSLIWWLAPVVLGLLLSIPLSYYSAREDLGLWLRDRGVLTIPEETDPPSVVTRANVVAEQLADADPAGDALARVIADPTVHALHRALLPANTDFAVGDPENLAQARSKLKSSASGAALSVSETIAVLFDAVTLAELHEEAVREAARAGRPAETGSRNPVPEIA